MNKIQELDSSETTFSQIRIGQIFRINVVYYIKSTSDTAVNLHNGESRFISSGIPVELVNSIKIVSNDE